MVLKLAMFPEAVWGVMDSVMAAQSDRSGNVVQVWDYDRSAEMRDTEGGASKRSVLEQAEKLKKYLAAESL